MSVRETDGDASVLDPALLRRLRARNASAERTGVLASLMDLLEHWREEGGAPRTGHGYQHWPGRKAEWAPDAGNHLLVNPSPDGPKERHRRYCSIVISMLLILRLSPAELQRTTGFDFVPRSMIATLRGKNWGRRDRRRTYLTAAVCAALDRGYTVAEVIDWLAGWGAPVESRDPVLYFDDEGIARGEPEPPGGPRRGGGPPASVSAPLLGRTRPGGIYAL